MSVAVKVHVPSLNVTKTVLIDNKTTPLDLMRTMLTKLSIGSDADDVPNNANANDNANNTNANDNPNDTNNDNMNQNDCLAHVELAAVLSPYRPLSPTHVTQPSHSSPLSSSSAIIASCVSTGGGHRRHQSFHSSSAASCTPADLRVLPDIDRPVLVQLSNFPCAHPLALCLRHKPNHPNPLAIRRHQRTSSSLTAPDHNQSIHNQNNQNSHNQNQNNQNQNIHNQNNQNNQNQNINIMETPAGNLNPIRSVSLQSFKGSVKKFQKAAYRFVHSQPASASSSATKTTKSSSPTFLFGRRLSQITLLDPETNVPLAIETLLKHIESHDMSTEGIFRLSGASSAVQHLRRVLDTSPTGGKELDLTKLHEGHPNVANIDAHAIASLVKLFLRDLPEPLLMFSLYDAWVAAKNIVDQDARLYFLWRLVHVLPPSHFYLLKRLCLFFHALAKNESDTKMPVNNLATVLGVNILRRPVINDTDSSDMRFLTTEAAHANALAVSLIQYADLLFLETFHYGNEEYRHAGSSDTVKKVAVAMFSYEPHFESSGHDMEVEFSEGMVILVFDYAGPSRPLSSYSNRSNESVSNGWWIGEVIGETVKRGILPENYVDVVYDVAHVETENEEEVGDDDDGESNKENTDDLCVCYVDHDVQTTEPYVDYESHASLLYRVAELESIVASLKDNNAALQEQLSASRSRTKMNGEPDSVKEKRGNSVPNRSSSPTRSATSSASRPMFAVKRRPAPPPPPVSAVHVERTPPLATRSSSSYHSHNDEKETPEIPSMITKRASSGRCSKRYSGKQDSEFPAIPDSPPPPVPLSTDVPSFMLEKGTKSPRDGCEDTSGGDVDADAMVNDMNEKQEEKDEKENKVKMNVSPPCFHVPPPPMTSPPVSLRKW